jgi:hypothetical protein
MSDEATIVLSFEEAATLMSALDHALCHQQPTSRAERDHLRPLIDKMSSTFGFPTDRLDELLKGRKVKPFTAAFETMQMARKTKAWFKRMRGGE